MVNPPRGYQARGIHWTEPELVAEVAFTGWTADGHLRHPSFRGLREDKEASEVVRETPSEVPVPTREAVPWRRASSPARKAHGARSAGPAAAAARPAAGSPAWRGASGGGEGLEIAGVRVSNPHRVLYPEQGITKLELVRYYERVAERMLPYLAGRPLTLLRCPAGRDKQCFYQKHLAEATPPSLVEVPVTERSGERTVYVCVESLAGLLALAQMGALELHPWGSRRQHLEKPDILVFDLDPGPTVAWADVVAAAGELRDLLAELHLASFAKLTGGKGLHVVVPIVPDLTWEPAKAFTRAVVELLASRHPQRYVTVMAKARRQGRIFLDYLRNGFGNTAVAPYSTRARPGAPVATPVRWEELTPRLAANRYTLRNLPRRLAALRHDPWPGFFTLRQRVPRAVLRQLGVQ